LIKSVDSKGSIDFIKGRKVAGSLEKNEIAKLKNGLYGVYLYGKYLNFLLDIE
jgi:arginine decarboxylase-like protein